MKASCQHMMNGSRQRGEIGKREQERKRVVGDEEIATNGKEGRQGGEGEGSRHSSGGELRGEWRPQLGERALV